MVESQQEDWAVNAARQFAESAEGQGLKVPVEAVAAVFRQIETIDYIDLTGIERKYSTEETACFFEKSSQWMYWAMKPRDQDGGGMFYYPDGRPIEPETVGKRGIYRFNLDTIKDMGLSLYQHNNITLDGLKEIVRKIHMARMGRWNPDPEVKTPRARARAKAKAARTKQKQEG